MTPKIKTVAILALPGVQLLDVAGPLDVFAEANVQAGREAYRLQVIGQDASSIRTSSGVRLVPDQTITGNVAGKIDTLLVAGAPNAAEIVPSRQIIAWLRALTPNTRRYGSVCSGAFILAHAGLLKGRRVTTHWAVASELARRFPEIKVEPDAIHIRDGRVRTAAGVTAGLDLALALVEEDLGREIALQVAAQLVMFFKRAGGQGQFSRQTKALPAGRAALQEIQRWVMANPGADHTVASLASRAALSPRHFARIFRQEVGLTPAEWVVQARIAAARRSLESDRTSLKQIAALSGFADAGTLRRAFIRLVGISPAEYRKRHVSPE